MIRKHFAAALIAIGFLATAAVSQARAQTVALDCIYPFLGQNIHIVIDYGRSIVSVYPDLAHPLYSNVLRDIPPSDIEGDHVVHTASITDDYVKWSGNAGVVSGDPDTLVPYDFRVGNASIDRKTGEFLVAFGMPVNGPSTSSGSCTKRSDTNKF